MSTCGVGLCSSLPAAKLQPVAHLGECGSHRPYWHGSGKDPGGRTPGSLTLRETLEAVPKNYYVPVRQDPEKMRYIEWLTTPPRARDPATEAEFARMIDVHTKTLYNWKQDREFRDVWQGETDQIIGDLDRRQAVLDTLFEAARDPRNPRHVAASKLYLEAVGAMSPAKLEVSHSHKAVGMLTDDELDRLIARGAAELRAERRAADGPAD